MMFSGLDSDELERILSCLDAREKSLKRDENALCAGEKPEHIGIVLTGMLHIIREDYEGRRVLVAALSPGEVFAEALCCAGVLESPVTITADIDSAVLLLRFTHIPRTCSNACAFHGRLVRNLLEIIACKNLQLQNRMETIRLRSVRVKVLRYLESFLHRQGRNITIPFNREELADYLCVERSALSHELARMKRDGLIDYRKNNFILKKL